MCECLICNFTEWATAIGYIRSLSKHKLALGLLKVLHRTAEIRLKNVQVAITIPVSNGDVGTNPIQRPYVFKGVLRS
jgi:hypothetical protein